MPRYLPAAACVVLTVAATAISVRARPTGQPAFHLPDAPYRYAGVDLPAHVIQSPRHDDNTPSDNPLTDHGATLGRVLFYDTRLSANNRTSCSSCHLQAHAFSDPRPASRGFRGAFTDRRAMPLVNLRYYERARFFWDERAGNLEEMVLQPIHSRVEMGQDSRTLVELLAHDPAYPGLFERAFGDSQISESRIGRALAQFVRSMVSYRSRYDNGRARARSAQDDFDNFTRQENRGKALFMRHCSNCHMKDGNEHFFVPTPANTGLRPHDPQADGGVGDVTMRGPDLGSFKSPSLRNVEVTAPYAHDGRFATLEAVIDHYSENPLVDLNLGYVMPVAPLKFTTSEKTALTAFLKTLTDRAFLSDPKFASPFANQKRDASPAERMRVVPPRTSRLASFNASDVLERILSFDANKDHRIARDELPERMEGLVSRGDKNQDGLLTPDEVGALLDTRPATPQQSVAAPGAQTLADVIADLKLPLNTHNLAMATVKAPLNANAPTRFSIDTAMRELLDDEDYENFVAAADRMQRAPRLIGHSANVIID